MVAGEDGLVKMDGPAGAAGRWRVIQITRNQRKGSSLPGPDLTFFLIFLQYCLQLVLLLLSFPQIASAWHGNVVPMTKVSYET